MKRVAFFISSHGFGHAARCCAVMESIIKTEPSVYFEIFTTVPEFFFLDSIEKKNFRYHFFLNDVGLIQSSPTQIDHKATVEALDKLIPFRSTHFDEIENLLNSRTPDIVVSDISPLGIAFAKSAGLTSILMENFTWDWVYEPLMKIDKKFKFYSSYLKDIFTLRDHHLQLIPFCGESKNSLKFPPVSRSPKNSITGTRSQMGITPSRPMILITMGGFSNKADLPAKLMDCTNYQFIFTGKGKTIEKVGNLTMIPANSGFFHPDLVNASDLIIGKPGYSTIGETYNSGKPFGYFSRDGFRESKVLEEFIKRNMVSIKLENFRMGRWIEQIEVLLKTPQKSFKRDSEAADSIASFILSKI